ncbi:PREDICTED: uncharacterized protein LOC106114350 [Papilio xuthus]|uniref:Uncharacterized protein LOC106114350 n=2 Tax=Papilio xuthus TaxID=66420 RepID=A0AAJ6Z152_PAPXU|nr:PREDICTED: uncharacterized protein LOC106114350 [Papilio xuthus]
MNSNSFPSIKLTRRTFSEMRSQIIFITFAIILVLVQSHWSLRSEDRCINYYRTGRNFDLNQMNGEFYAVYFWPPIQRERDTCGVLNFRIMSDEDVEAATAECDGVIDDDDTVVQATYRNSTGKLVNVIYFGNEEVKHLMRSCDKVYKYLFIRINDDYVMGINCSSGGRGILLAKYLPGLSEVQTVVRGIEFMTGREGKPDCPLQ